MRAVSLLLLAGCAAEAVSLGTDREAGEYAVVADVPPQLGRALDLLFVVDNTDGMAARQLALATSFDRLLAHLEFVEGGQPDLHVGVVSTDLGAGSFAGTGCDRLGDQGVLQAAPRLPGCAAPAERWLADDGRDRNFGGAIGDAFACISPLGTGGCGYEQPLESMRRALDGSRPENDGFLRPDAALGVVVLSDEDDCSVFDDGLFDPAADWLGPESFRCFAYGVQCHGDDVAMPGRREGCRPREGSPYLMNVDGYVEFLHGLKPEPERIVVSGLIGDPSLVEVAVDLDGAPQLVPSCRGGGEAAYPAVRLQGFLDGFPRKNELTSICTVDSEPFGALAATGRQLRRALGTRCLDGELADVDLGRAGLQPDCRVTAIPAGGEPRRLAGCDEPYAPEDSSELPCYRLLTGIAPCGDFPSQLAVDVAGAEQPARLIVECVLR